MYAGEHVRCALAYRAAHTTLLRGTRDSKGAQLLGARLCLQSLVRYTVQAGDRAKQPAAIMGSAGLRGTERKALPLQAVLFRSLRIVRYSVTQPCRNPHNLTLEDDKCPTQS